ncbi:MAG TPA: phytoene/squalene synthase family protein [Thermomicrobiaceae bacterium]|nr:phytoene/squalene synthase family protein [Thermomicrobiaceae bacterium]
MARASSNRSAGTEFVRGFPRGAGPSDPHAHLLATHARTFNFAARFLPADLRQPVTVLYAFSRTLDDLVDEPHGANPPAVAGAELDAWRTWLERGREGRVPREPLGAALAGVIERFQIPTGYLVDLVDGLAEDLTLRDVADTAALRRYCYGVAATVGLAMAHVLGATSPPALAAAGDLGTAMQLTNILRDVGADLGRGRLYLPADVLARCGLSRSDVEELAARGAGPDDRLRAVMRAQLTQAREYYARGMAGIWLLPPDCRLPVLIAARLYRRILDVIEANDYDTLRRRAATTRAEKLREAAIAAMLDRLWRHGERRRRSIDDGGERWDVGEGAFGDASTNPARP